MCHGWSRDCSVLFQTVAVAAVPGRNGELISKITWCSLRKKKAADSWPFKALVFPPLHMMSKILCNHSETTNYTAIKTACQASISRQETLTRQPSCQLMCVNNYSRKSVTDPSSFWRSGTPVESKLDKCNRTRAAQDNTIAFSQQMTPLGQSRLSFHHSYIALGPVSFRPGC